MALDRTEVSIWSDRGGVLAAAGTGWLSKPAGGRSDVTGKLGEEVLVYGVGSGAGDGQFGQFGEKPYAGVYAEAGGVQG